MTLTAVPPHVWVLVVLACASAIVHIVADRSGRKSLVYAAKPTTTTLLIIVAAIAPSHSRYAFAILAGLVFSLAGDIFLMLPRDRFVAGLVAFLIAHIAYIIAFCNGVAFLSRPLWLAPYSLAALLVLSLLWPRLGHLRIPVAIYVIALVLMATQASVRAEALGGIAVAAAIGAALFIVSDATLAVNRFRAPFRSAQILVMTTYVAAQILIALSAYGR